MYYARRDVTNSGVCIQIYSFIEIINEGTSYYSSLRNNKSWMDIPVRSFVF